MIKYRGSFRSKNSCHINVDNYRMPTETTLNYVTKLAIIEDKPILMDYWTPSIDKKACIGVKENKEKLLVKSSEEYTSLIQKVFKAGSEFIIITENSIYIVDRDIPTRKISYGSNDLTG
jgi:hypothetical protein